ncbi:hypothetical protein NP233_g10579 [Leucocoprinus birnbaumii]|uniref:GST N-terminal domain-containing protein n=1 Tax=Leucocoprinus birnbaumii TaxID=56174 RepID=A0AAD5VKG9_9AGAR|nr:hypothetical protein NP233_g10579 [Leucocoprinus birnbaumii]
MITLYNISAKDPIVTFSPNVWKARYVLNYKKIAYKTIHVEFPNIESVTKNAGIPPNGMKRDGSGPYYTAPAITDDSTGTAISDSYKIAEYLDKAYPALPNLAAPLWPLILPRVPGILNEEGAEYYRRTRAARFGKPLDQMEPVGEARKQVWVKAEAAMGQIDRWMSKSSGPFFMGETVTFVDFVVVAMLKAMKILIGESSEEWKEVEKWHGGRWKNLLERMESYASVDMWMSVEAESDSRCDDEFGTRVRSAYRALLRSSISTSDF